MFHKKTKQRRNGKADDQHCQTKQKADAQPPNKIEQNESTTSCTKDTQTSHQMERKKQIVQK